MYAKIMRDDGVCETMRVSNYTRRLLGVPRGFVDDIEIELMGYMEKIIDTVKVNQSMEARRVIYNGPATIVLWADGTKTVVKCDPEDEQNQMLGLALCYMKKALGNSSRKFNDALHAEGF